MFGSMQLTSANPTSGNPSPPARRLSRRYAGMAVICLVAAVAVLLIPSSGDAARRSRRTQIAAQLTPTTLATPAADAADAAVPAADQALALPPFLSFLEDILDSLPFGLGDFLRTFIESVLAQPGICSFFGTCASP